MTSSLPRFPTMSLSPKLVHVLCSMAPVPLTAAWPYRSSAKGYSPKTFSQNSSMAGTKAKVVSA
ncbi:MAG: hypothetical protein ABIK65_02565 [Candidatus Eisenbacteria bacterium]